MALRKDGTVWEWGEALINPRKNDSSEPYNHRFDWVSTLSHIKHISVGRLVGVALNIEGLLWAWGTNAFGEIGDGTTIDRPLPVVVPGLPEVTGVDVGSDHVLAVMANGTVSQWGRDLFGPKGASEPSNQPTPLFIPGLEDMISVASGGQHSLALKNNGTVWAWGDNEFGQLGDGSNVDRAEPARISDLVDIVLIDAGEGTSLALKNDGSVWEWGLVDKDAPTRVKGLEKVVAISAGYWHEVAVLDDGSVWTWGANSAGQLGYGTHDREDHAAPAQVVGLPPVTIVAAGEDFTLVVAEDGNLWGWGVNHFGQLGDGTTQIRLLPVQIGKVG